MATKANRWKKHRRFCDTTQDLTNPFAPQVVQQEAFLMKRALDSKNLREALKHSAVMISELRTPVTINHPRSQTLTHWLQLLSPKNYYGLYMSVRPITDWAKWPMAVPAGFGRASAHGELLQGHAKHRWETVRK